jgi:hypothetical protein
VTTDELTQLPFVIVHLKMYEPGTNPLMVEVGEVGVVITEPVGPLTKDHKPVPIIGVFPFIVTTLPQTSWLGPAFETVTLSLMVISTWSELAGHIPLVIVH